MLKMCPKCNYTFECCVDNISKCHCFSVTINADTLAELKEEFDDCLCGKCFKLLAAKMHNQL
jgi:hypothetical protein